MGSSGERAKRTAFTGAVAVHHTVATQWRVTHDLSESAGVEPGGDNAIIFNALFSACVHTQQTGPGPLSAATRTGWGRIDDGDVLQPAKQHQLLVLGRDNTAHAAHHSGVGSASSAGPSILSLNDAASSARSACRASCSSVDTSTMDGRRF